MRYQLSATSDRRAGERDRYLVGGAIAISFPTHPHPPLPPLRLRALGTGCYGRNGFSDEAESDFEPDQSLVQVVRVPPPATLPRQGSVL